MHLLARLTIALLIGFLAFIALTWTLAEAVAFSMFVGLPGGIVAAAATILALPGTEEA